MGIHFGLYREQYDSGVCDSPTHEIIRVNAKYYGGKLTLYILGIFLAALVITSLILHS